MRNSLTFGGVNSADYGVYISGDAVHNAPKRSVESVVVPGRNGELTIDKGRYENITVEYPAFAYGKSRKEFRQKICAFRNAVASQIGYQRLEDTYHPDEYRMGVFKEGIDIEMGPYGGVGKFTLSFDCKPQRFLKEGEIPLSVESGEEVMNLTRHEAKPLLEVEGYGTIDIGDYEIELNDDIVGEIEALSAGNYNVDTTLSYSSTIANMIEAGDTLTLESLIVRFRFIRKSGLVSLIRKISARRTTSNITNWNGFTWEETSDTDITAVLSIGELTFTKGSDTTYSETIQIEMYVTYNGTTSTGTFKATLNIKYSDSSNYLKISLSSVTAIGYLNYKPTFTMSALVADSTQSVLGSPTYIDCDIGSAYKLIDDEPVSLDAYIDLGSDLPVLEPGSNEITYDNTVTELDIIPRWWKV